MVSASPLPAASTILVPKYTSDTNGLFSGKFSENWHQEAHLPVALFQQTNRSFDLKLSESVRTITKSPIIVSFLLVTFIFSSPNTNDPVYSFCEMGTPNDLVCSGKSVSRRQGSANDIPLIRVSTVDRHNKELSADLDLLLGVAPVDKPQDIQHVRRSFRFVYRDGWRED
jgi:hypothetical protein